MKNPLRWFRHSRLALRCGSVMATAMNQSITLSQQEKTKAFLFNESLAGLRKKNPKKFMRVQQFSFF